MAFLGSARATRPAWVAPGTTIAFTLHIFSSSSLLIHRYYVQLFGHHQFAHLYLEVQKNLRLVILNHPRGHILWPQDFQAILGTDLPVYHASYVVTVFHVCSACWHFAPCCYVLDCLRGIVYVWGLSILCSGLLFCDAMNSDTVLSFSPV